MKIGKKSREEANRIAEISYGDLARIKKRRANSFLATNLLLTIIARCLIAIVKVIGDLDD